MAASHARSFSPPLPHWARVPTTAATPRAASGYSPRLASSPPPRPSHRAARAAGFFYRTTASVPRRPCQSPTTHLAQSRAHPPITRYPSQIPARPATARRSAVHSRRWRWVEKIPAPPPSRAPAAHTPPATSRQRLAPRPSRLPAYRARPSARRSPVAAGKVRQGACEE